MEPVEKIKEMETDFFKKFKDYRQTGHRKQVYTLDWNSKGTSLASADNSIKIWKYKANSLQKEVEYSKSHGETVECISWHPKDSHVLASSSKDGAIKLWDDRQKNSLKSFKTKIENFCLSWRPDGQQFAFNNVISFYDFKQQKQIEKLKMAMDTSDFVWDPSGSAILVSGTQKNIGVICEELTFFFQLFITQLFNSHVQLLDGLNPQLPVLESIECHRACINTIVCDPNSRYFATAGNDALICLWDLQEMICLKTYDDLQGIIKKISFSCDSKYIATASEDPFIDIYSTEKGWLSYRIKCTTGQNAVKWNPKVNLLAFVGEDKDANEESVIHLYGHPQTQ